MRELLVDGRLPTSWIPPEQVREIRAVLELYKDLRDEHTAWVQRIHATLFHHGVPPLGVDVTSAAGRARLEAGECLSAAGQQAITVALRVMDALQTELHALHRQIRTFANHQPGCKALQAQYGVGPIISTVIWAMMGDTRRFSASRQAVRHTGLDVTVYSSDGKRSRGHLAKQGPPPLRWALYEAAFMASRTRAPTTTSTPASRNASTTNAPPSPSPARSPAARITSCVSSATRPTRRPDTRRGGCDGHAHQHLMRPRPASRPGPVAAPWRGRP
jgi:transposase